MEFRESLPQSGRESSVEGEHAIPGANQLIINPNHPPAMKTEIKPNETPPTAATDDSPPVILVSVIIGCAIGLSCLIGLTRVPDLISGLACEAIDSTIRAAAAPY